MPALTLTLDGATGKTNKWSHVSVPLIQIQTLLNTTLLDYANVQDNGLRTINLRSHANLENGRGKARNDSGGALTANDIIRFTGTYSDGTDNYPTIAKAIATGTATTNYFGQGILDANANDGTDCTVVLVKEVSGIDTSGGAVGDPVYLSTTAGGWTLTRPTGDQFVQVIGYISVVNASTGRIVFDLTMPQEEWVFGAAGGLGIYLDADRDSGIYASADDVLKVKVGGSDVFTFEATGVTATGVITGATLEATGDTAAGDNAAMGYTATEGLILTGQGSTSDVTIKNDADATVWSVATGTTTSTFAGDTYVANGYGVVIGHTAQLTDIGGVTGEFQYLGTAAADATIIHGHYAASTTGALYFAVKGRGGIGDVTALTTGDDIFKIVALGEDGTAGPANSSAILMTTEGTISNGQVPGVISLQTAASGTLTERLRIDSAGILFTGGETAHAGADAGSIIIDHNTGDGVAFAVKNSDVTTGLGSITKAAYTPEGDDYFTVGKASSTTGGAMIMALGATGNSSPLFIQAWSGAPATTDTSSSLASMNMFCGQHNGANGDADMAANSNALAVGEIDSSNARLTRMLLKADDGELHLGNTTLVALDAEDDNQIVRAMQKTGSSGGIIESRHDNPFYSYEKLVEMGLAGEKDAEDFFLFPLQSRLHAHEGAMWQTYCMVKDQQDQIETLTLALSQAQEKLERLN